MRLVEATPSPVDVAPAPRIDEVEQVPAVPLASLADIVDLSDKHRDMQLKIIVKNCVRLVSISPGRLDVSLTEGAPKTLLTDLSQKLHAWTGMRWMVSLSREQGGSTIAESETAKREALVTDARADPDVAAILSAFPGAKIIDVRIANVNGQADELTEDAVESGVPVDHTEPPAEDDD